jgi:hypothetical protein
MNFDLIKAQVEDAINFDDYLDKKEQEDESVELNINKELGSMMNSMLERRKMMCLRRVEPLI